MYLCICVFVHIFNCLDWATLQAAGNVIDLGSEWFATLDLYLCICAFVYLCICVFVQIFNCPDWAALQLAGTVTGLGSDWLGISVYSNTLDLYLCTCVFVYIYGSVYL